MTFKQKRIQKQDLIEELRKMFYANEIDNGQQQINDEEAQQWFEEQERESQKKLILEWVFEEVRHA